MGHPAGEGFSREGGSGEGTSPPMEGSRRTSTLGSTDSGSWIGIRGLGFVFGVLDWYSGRGLVFDRLRDRTFWPLGSRKTEPSTLVYLFLGWSFPEHLRGRPARPASWLPSRVGQGTEKSDLEWALETL